MIHPELKSLVWGRHLQRLAGALGLRASRPEPPPKVVRMVPLWFQRLGAALTMLGLVAGFRLLDRSISTHHGPAVEQAALSSVDSSSLNEWAVRLHLRLNPFGLHTQGESEDADAPGDSVSPATATTPKALPTERGGRPNYTFRRILATAYSTASAGNGGPAPMTASNTVTEAGVIALSRDLPRTFNPDAPFDFGDKILIPGVGIFEVRDTMSPRWTARADLWFSSPDRARSWGVRTVFATRVGGTAPTEAYQFSSR